MSPSRRSSYLLGSLALALFLAPASGRNAWAHVEASASPCPLPETDRELVQRALDAWALQQDEALGIDSRPLPWIVFLGSDCVWHLERRRASTDSPASSESLWNYRGRPVDTWVVEAGDQVELPSGELVPKAPIAKTVLGPEGPFFVLAMPEIWAAHPAFEAQERRAKLPDFWLGVSAHELVHTVQLAPVVARIEGLQAENDLPESFDDDIIQDVYSEDAVYSTRVANELDLLFAAAVEEDSAQKRERAKAALEAIQRRRAEFFQGERVVYAELDELFLALEGAATWAAFQLQVAGKSVSSELRSMEEERSFHRRKWVQAQGLLLYLLVDEFVPDWKDRSFAGDLPPGPIEMLSAAL